MPVFGIFAINRRNRLALAAFSKCPDARKRLAPAARDRSAAPAHEFPARAWRRILGLALIRTCLEIHAACTSPFPFPFASPVSHVLPFRCLTSAVVDWIPSQRSHGLSTPHTPSFRCCHCRHGRPSKAPVASFGLGGRVWAGARLRSNHQSQQ
jgi:hypothetical protein